MKKIHQLAIVKKSTASKHVLLVLLLLMFGNVHGANHKHMLLVEDVGFSLPETVLHDQQKDIYLVSNIAGKIPAKDDNGFISRVAPNGDVIDLKWIDGSDEQTTLHSPKGMVLHGRYLYVVDIDTVRVFDRETGRHVNDIVLVGTTFLNDIIVDKKGNLYVSESALEFDNGSFKATQQDAIYKISTAGIAKKWVSGTSLGQPNGLEVLPNGDIAVVTRGGDSLYALNDGKQKTLIAKLPGKVLDGLIYLAQGDFLVTSWQTSKMYRIGPKGNITIELELPVPAANIGYDVTRNRVLLPLLKNNSIAFFTMKK